MTAPVKTSAEMVTLLQQQLADICAAKTAAIVAITNALTNGPKISYTISGKAGSESVSAGEYLANLRNQIREFTALEIELLDTLQSLQPYSVSLYMENAQPLGF